MPSRRGAGSVLMVAGLPILLIGAGTAFKYSGLVTQTYSVVDILVIYGVPILLYIPYFLIPDRRVKLARVHIAFSLLSYASATSVVILGDSQIASTCWMVATILTVMSSGIITTRYFFPGTTSGYLDIANEEPSATEKLRLSTDSIRDRFEQFRASVVAEGDRIDRIVSEIVGELESQSKVLKQTERDLDRTRALVAANDAISKLTDEEREAFIQSVSKRRDAYEYAVTFVLGVASSLVASWAVRGEFIRGIFGW